MNEDEQNDKMWKKTLLNSSVLYFLSLYAQTWAIPSIGTVVSLQELIFAHMDKTALRGSMQVKKLLKMKQS